MSETILRFCETCGRQTAHDAMALNAARGDQNPAVITVHYCSVHRGAQTAAAKHLAELARAFWGSE